VDEHPVLGRVNYSVHELGNDPDSQVSQTIQVMRERVAEDCTDPQFIARAQSIINPQGVEMDQNWIARQVWAHVKQAIQFQRDEATGVRGDGLSIGGGDPSNVVEVLIRPVDMARYIDQGIAIGDCDDFSSYLAAMLKSLGVDCAFCTVAANAQVPKQYSHVYVVGYPDGQRVPCDASHGQWCGWEYGNGTERRTEWPVYDKTRLFLGNLVVNAALVAGAWFGWQYLKREGI
jgi:hypothetical protein